jgi:hypothetical protein
MASFQRQMLAQAMLCSSFRPHQQQQSQELASTDGFSNGQQGEEEPTAKRIKLEPTANKSSRNEVNWNGDSNFYR